MIIVDTDSLSFYFSVISYFTFVVASEHDQHTFVQKLNFAMIVSYYIKLKCVCVCVIFTYIRHKSNALIIVVVVSHHHQHDFHSNS